MLTVNIQLIIAQIVTFLVGLFLLWLVAYKPILGVFRRRADKIRQDLEAAAAARAEMEAIKSQYDKEMATLAEKAQQIVQQAAHAGQQARDDLLGQARNQGQELLRQAAERIAIEKAKALKELRQEVVALSLQIAEKAIGQAMTAELQQRLIDQTLDQMESKS